MHWISLNSYLISLAPFCFLPPLVYVLRWLTHGEEPFCLEAIYPVRMKVSKISVIKMTLRGELVSTAVVSLRIWTIFGCTVVTHWWWTGHRDIVTC